MKTLILDGLTGFCSGVDLRWGCWLGLGHRTCSCLQSTVLLAMAVHLLHWKGALHLCSRLLGPQASSGQSPSSSLLPSKFHGRFTAMGSQLKRLSQMAIAPSICM